MLEIKNLTIGYQTERGMVKAVNRVDFHVEKGKIVGLVGESGCGKSTVLFSILGLIPYPGQIVEGQILFEGRDLTANSPKEWRQIRGKEIAMIFQDPMTALNPAYRVGEQIREVMKTHRPKEVRRYGFLRRKALKKREMNRVIEMMREVGIPAAEERYFEYPHQFSGGMQQRAMIAMALVCAPKLLLADEPTTALDVTIQAQILDLLRQINRTHGTSIVLVTHDLGVAAEFCDEVAVMYAGQIVERGPTSKVMKNPRHPYTQGLLRSIPRISGGKRKIQPIPGQLIDLLELKEECAFLARCPYARPACRKAVGMTTLDDGSHQVRCVLYEEGSGKDDPSAACS